MFADWRNVTKRAAIIYYCNLQLVQDFIPSCDSKIQRLFCCYYYYLTRRKRPWCGTALHMQVAWLILVTIITITQDLSTTSCNYYITAATVDNIIFFVVLLPLCCWIHIAEREKTGRKDSINVIYIIRFICSSRVPSLFHIQHSSCGVILIKLVLVQSAGFTGSLLDYSLQFWSVP